MVAAALIGAGASLLGGLFGRNSAKKQQAAQNEYDKPINVRARAEEGGFNPLLWAGAGNVSAPVSPNNFLGNGIANAGLLLADGMDKRAALKLEETRLKEDRAKLDKLLETQTLRPKVGGIYAGSQSTPSIKKTGAPLLAGSLNGTPQRIVGGQSTPSTFADMAVESNVEAPKEFEAEAFGAAERGLLLPWLGDLAVKNTQYDGNARVYERRVERSPLGQIWRNEDSIAKSKAEKKKSDKKKADAKRAAEQKRKAAKRQRTTTIPFPSYLPSISD